MSYRDARKLHEDEFSQTKIDADKKEHDDALAKLKEMQTAVEQMGNARIERLKKHHLLSMREGPLDGIFLNTGESSEQNGILKDWFDNKAKPGSTMYVGIAQGIENLKKRHIAHNGKHSGTMLVTHATFDRDENTKVEQSNILFLENKAEAAAKKVLIEQATALSLGLDPNDEDVLQSFPPDAGNKAPGGEGSRPGNHQLRFCYLYYTPQ